jgi:hypothetical protein
MAMDATLQKIERMNADPDFVEFVMAWHGVTGATEVPFTVEKESAAYQKRIKRWTRRDWGTDWRCYWKVILNECWKARRLIVLQKNLFTMEPRGPNPHHRRRNEARWNAVFDLRNYFIKNNARPHMGVLGRLFCPNQNEDTFSGEWHERKDWFKDEDGAARLEQLELFYTHNRTRILETLRTRIPFYAKWESGSPVSPSDISN